MAKKRKQKKATIKKRLSSEHPEDIYNHSNQIITQTEGTLERALKQGIEGCGEILKSLNVTDNMRKTASLTRLKYQQLLKKITED